MSDYLLHRRGLKNGSVAPAEKKAPVPIPKRSEKMKEAMKKYKPIMIAWLAKPENKYCQIKMKGCTKIATQIHHSAGRQGEQLMKEEDFIASCSHCNVIGVEENDAEAREKGFKKTRLGKSKKSVQ